MVLIVSVNSLFLIFVADFMLPIYFVSTSDDGRVVDGRSISHIIIPSSIE